MGWSRLLLGYRTYRWVATMKRIYYGVSAVCHLIACVMFGAYGLFYPSFFAVAGTASFGVIAVAFVYLTFDSEVR